MNIVVVGMGYVGIPVAALFADVDGFQVTGLQRRSERSGWKIDYLNQGKSPIGGDEPGLSELIEKVVDKGSFHVTDDTSVYREADAILVTVQTPVDENHQPVYASLKQVCKDVGERLKTGTLISLESTVAPGTIRYFVKPILEEESGLRAGVDFNLVFSYERVMVGRLLHNLTNYPRIVGGLTTECAQRGVDLYRHIVTSELYPTDCLTAEVSKVTENTYRDVNIAFANEVALMCESLGVNVYDVRRFVNSLPYDPSNPSANPFRDMHLPGAGVGGHCLPKDPWLLKYGVDAYGKSKVESKVIVSSREVNDYMPQHMAQLVGDALAEKGRELEDSDIAILGFAFVENSDDPRNTPAFPLYELLKERCLDITVHDPYIEDYDNMPLTSNLEEAVKGSDCLALVTKHDEYLGLTPEWLGKRMNTLCVVDGRNAFDRESFLDLGFSFRGVGLPRG